MRDRIESLEDKIMSVASQQQKATETEEKTEPSEAVEANDDKETAKTLADTQPIPSPVYNGIPVYYQIPVTDSAGRVIQHLPVVPAQLVQIKSAIEKGLTEGQLVELINNNVSAEKMKEIIEIAVLENSMTD